MRIAPWGKFLFLAVMIPVALFAIAVARGSDTANSTRGIEVEREVSAGPSGQPLEGSGFLSHAVLEIEFPHGPAYLGHVMGVVWDGTNYYNNDGGSTPSNVNQYDDQGALIQTFSADYDGRSLVEHPGGIIHASSLFGSIHLGLAPYTQVCEGLVGLQTGHAVLSNGNIVAHNYGQITEYTFPACVQVNSVALNPVCPDCTTYPYSNQLASSGEHLFVLSNLDEVWVYDYPSGNHIATVDLGDTGGFDTFITPFSLSYDDSSAPAGGGGLIYVAAPNSFTIRGYRIQDCQAGLVFPETILAADKGALVWSTPRDVEFVRGFLSAVSSHAVRNRGALVASTALDISQDNPPSGAGAYYLVKPTGPSCASWQTVSDAEPARDSEIFLGCRIVSPSQTELEAAVAIAKQGLSDPWGNQDEFVTLYDRIQEELLCVFDEPTPTEGQFAANYTTASCDTTPSTEDCEFGYCAHVGYCGPNDSSGDSSTFGWWFTFGASTCLNEVCFCHDACYRENCINADGPGLSCNFSKRSIAAGCEEDWGVCGSPCLGDGPANVSVCAYVMGELLIPEPCSGEACSGPGQVCDPTTGHCVDVP